MVKEPGYMKQLQMDADKKIIKGSLDSIILGIIKAEKRMHGYGIINRIRKTFDVYFGPSTIYPALHALEKKGLVHSEWNMNTEIPRKEYVLDEKALDYIKCGEKAIKEVSDFVNFQVHEPVTEKARQ